MYNYDEIIYYVRKKELLNLKSSKLCQILCVDKTGFCRLGYIYRIRQNSRGGKLLRLEQK